MDSELPCLRTCSGRMLFGGLLNSLPSIKCFTSKAKTIVFTFVLFNRFFLSLQASVSIIFFDSLLREVGLGCLLLQESVSHELSLSG
mgnify:CR=1 FL=1